jgi:hypothetical protein
MKAARLKAPPKPINMLGESDVNHLRRLLGYVRCEIGQSPEEVIGTVQLIASKCGPIDTEGQQRLVQHYQQSARVPKYVRDAVKALEKVVRE